MSVNPVRTRRNTLKTTAVTGAVLLGTALFLLQTFPHLKTSVYNYFHGSPHLDDSDMEDVVEETETIDISESIVEVSEPTLNQSALSEWSQADLKSWLIDKEIHPPSNATSTELISLVQSIQELPQ